MLSPESGTTLISETADSTTTTEVISDDDLMAVIIGSYGDLELAAERSELPVGEVIKRFPTLDSEKLLAGIKVALTIQTFASYTTVKTIALAQLDELTGPQIAKYMLDLTDRLARLVSNDEAGGGGGINVQFNNAQVAAEQSDARNQLIKRVVVDDVSGGPDSGDRQPEPAGAISTTV